MFKKKDPNSFTKYFTLFNGTPGNAGINQIGYLIANYHVVPYDDVEVKDTQSFIPSSKKQFMLHCTQRIVIYNANFITLSPIQPTDNYPYENYPVLLNPSLLVTPAQQQGVTMQLLDYSPKTINTKVQTSGSTGIGTTSGQSSSISNTVGSSTSQTNSYGTSVGMDAGVMGDIFSFGVNASQTSESSTTNTTDQSTTNGSENSSGQSRDASSSDSMNIKDWGAYAIINPTSQEPSWFFGQEYPWDAITCRLTNGTTNPNKANQNANNQNMLVLPIDMTNRLYDGYLLYPPSQLSLFGYNFISKALWLIDVDYSQTGASSALTIEHDLNYYSASHSLYTNPTPPPPKAVGVYMDSQPILLQCNNTQDGSIITNLNLLIMALDVVGLPNKHAIIGFLPKKFIVYPSIAPFKITSSSNTLLIEDSTSYTGSYPTTSPAFTVSETALNASTGNGLPSILGITFYFKVIDNLNDYTLYMKHWITGTEGVKLTFNINSTYTITKYVTNLEAEGGDNNLLAIALRNHDYSSVDYHDYLQLGLNVITLSIESIDGPAETFNYQIRAVSIEKS